MKVRIGPINAATPTPLLPDRSFDYGSGKRLCQRWVDVGLDGVLILGSMGEGLLLAEQARTAFVEQALSEIGDRLTIFVSAADYTSENMRRRALQYSAMGAHAVVLSAPVGAAPQDALEQVLKVCDACPAPCVYYEVPPVTGVALSAEQIATILAHPNVCAFKDSSNNPLLTQVLTAPDRQRNGVQFLDGVEYRVSLSSYFGYDGVIHGGGVLTARLVRSIWEKVQQGPTAEARELDRQNSLFLGRVYNRLAGPVQNVAGQKYALKLMGILEHEALLVDQRLDDASRHRIAGVLAENADWL